MKYFLAEGIKNGAHRLQISGVSPHHDRQLSMCRADTASAHGRIQRVHVLFGELSRRILNCLRQH